MNRSPLIVLLGLALASVLTSHPSSASTAEAVVVATDPVGDAPIDVDVQLGPGAGSAAGLDVVELAIGKPADSELEFVVRLNELNAPPPGEVVRYLWMMTVGGAEYWISAKTSDFSTVTTLPDDPTGPATHVGTAIRLRGPCVTVGAVRTCSHVSWLEGVFDTEEDEVRVRVPLGSVRSPHFVPGASIEMREGQDFAASVQVILSNDTTSDLVLGADVEPYTIP